jgi:hypothetical protein
MATWKLKGLLTGAAMYIITIILLPIIEDNPLTPFRLLTGIVLWIVAGLAVGYLFFNKKAKGKKKKAVKKR